MISQFIPKKVSTMTYRFSLVNAIRRGNIESGHRLRQTSFEFQATQIKCIYYCLSKAHQKTINSKHSFLILQDINENIYKLDLTCPELNHEEVQVEYSEEEKCFYSFTINAKNNVIMKNIVDYLNNNFVYRAYNFGINDCQAFCKKILMIFCEGQPKYTDNITDAKLFALIESSEREWLIKYDSAKKKNSLDYSKLPLKIFTEDQSYISKKKKQLGKTIISRLSDSNLTVNQADGGTKKGYLYKVMNSHRGVMIEASLTVLSLIIPQAFGIII